MSFTTLHLFFDDLEVGQEWESPGRTITEADIVNFAGLSGDFNPIHIDHQFAQSTLFHKPIAHGLLVFSIASGLGLYSPPVRTLAFLEIKEWLFKKPVFIGDTLRVRNKVLEKVLRCAVGAASSPGIGRSSTSRAWWSRKGPLRPWSRAALPWPRRRAQKPRATPVRNPKSEIRNPKLLCPKISWSLGFVSDFGFRISDFGFRISDFGFRILTRISDFLVIEGDTACRCS